MYPSLFLSALSSQSDRTLSLCWEQHCKLLPGVQGVQAKQVAAWSVDQVRNSCTHNHVVLVVEQPPLQTPVSGIPQVFRFVQNLIGCEEQARVFKDEVRKSFIWLLECCYLRVMNKQFIYILFYLM